MTLKEIIKCDQEYYDSYPTKRKIKFLLTNDHLYQVRKYMIFLRKEEHFFNKEGLFNRAISFYYARKKNCLGNKLGFYILPNCVGKGCIIYHHGSIIIHGDAFIGEGCKLHGNNCIGNNGIDNKAPKLGKNVDIGFGAVILGGVTIADNVKIGAGAVVVRDCHVEGATLVGVPAKIKK